MAISGRPYRCPFCSAALWAPPSEPLGHKRCPRCGAELGVIHSSKGPVFFALRPGRSINDLLPALASKAFGFSANQIERMLKEADLFDLVEFVMELADAVLSQ